MHRPMASQSSIHQTLLLLICCVRQQFPKLIPTPLPRTRDSSMTLTWVLQRPTTCHTPARTPIILAYQSHPSLRVPCLTTPHPPPRLHRPRRRQTIKPLPQRATTSLTFLLRRLLGSSRAGTSPPVATEPLASLPILRVRTIPAPCPRQLSTLLPMNNLLILPTFIQSLHRRLSFNRPTAYPLPTIFPPSPHSQQHSPSHRHLRNLCTSATPRRLCLPCRSPSTRRGHLYQLRDLTAPCPLSLPRTLTLVNFLYHSLSLLRPPRMSLPPGRCRLPRLTHNLRLHLSRTNAITHRLNKMVHKSRLHTKALFHVVIVARVGVQAFAVRHLAVVVSRRACSSPLAAAEMGMHFEFVCTQLAEVVNWIFVETIVASRMFWPTFT